MNTLSTSDFLRPSTGFSASFGMESVILELLDADLVKKNIDLDLLHTAESRIW